MNEVERILTDCLVPDLAGRPLYVVHPEPGTALESLGMAQGACFTRADLAAAMQPSLAAAGRWRGPGVAVAIVPSGELIRDLGNGCHELGHWLTAPELRVVDNTGIQSAIDSAPADYFTPAPTTIPPAYWAHDGEFIRACCHVWHRVSKLLPDLQPRDLGFGNVYPSLGAMHFPHTYVDALWSELVSTTGTIRAVLTTPPPAEFSRMVAADLEAIFGTALAARREVAA